MDAIIKEMMYTHLEMSSTESVFLHEPLSYYTKKNKVVDSHMRRDDDQLQQHTAESNHCVFCGHHVSEVSLWNLIQMGCSPSTAFNGQWGAVHSVQSICSILAMLLQNAKFGIIRVQDRCGQIKFSWKILRFDDFGNASRRLNEDTYILRTPHR